MQEIKPPARFKEGDWVRIPGTPYDRVLIYEERGRLGPGGSMVYRIEVSEDPFAYIEMRDDMLEPAEQ